MEKNLIVDLDYCIGCQSCEAACRAAFKGEARIRYGWVREVAFVPLPCRHCTDPLCAKACPESAMVKDEKSGLVYRRSFLCIGCHSCIYACPFGVLEPGLLRHVVMKCDYCKDRPAGPRCAASCASGALKFVAAGSVTKALIGARSISRSPFWRRT
jgi:carbon-monoxide dehydrogenase iron sulfur subunit